MGVTDILFTVSYLCVCGGAFTVEYAILGLAAHGNPASGSQFAISHPKTLCHLSTFTTPKDTPTSTPIHTTSTTEDTVSTPPSPVGIHSARFITSFLIDNHFFPRSSPLRHAQGQNTLLLCSHLCTGVRNHLSPTLSSTLTLSPICILTPNTKHRYTDNTSTSTTHTCRLSLR